VKYWKPIQTPLEAVAIQVQAHSVAPWLRGPQAWASCGSTEQREGLQAVFGIH